MLMIPAVRKASRGLHPLASFYPMTNTLFHTAALLAYAVLLPGAEAPAQAVSTTPVPVLVVIPSAQNAGEYVRISRNAIDGYVITIPPDAANAQSLRLAIRRITHLLDRDGDAERSDLTDSIPKPTAANQFHSRDRMLRRLLASPPRDFPRIGAVRATYLFLPDSASRAALKSSQPRTTSP